jgi:hypothetical protein
MLTNNSKILSQDVVVASVYEGAVRNGCAEIDGLHLACSARKM